MAINQIFLSGRLTRDVELVKTKSGLDIAKFTVASSEVFNTADGVLKEEVTFVDCQNFGKRSKYISQNGKKGRPVVIAGQLTQDNWQNKEGEKRTKLVITVSNLEFLDFIKKQDNAEAQQEVSRRSPRAAKTAKEPVSQEKEEDIPF